MSVARLIVALSLSALSLLLILPAPNHSLWEMSIAVGERGYWLVPVTLLTAFIGARSTIISRLTTVLSLIAAGILLLPLAQAASIGSHIEADMNGAFGRTGGTMPAAVSAARLFRADPTASSPRTLTFPISDSSGAHANDSLRLDYYRPTTNQRAPLIVTIHGGSWAGGDRTDLPELNSLLAEHGYAVAAASYRFAPEHPFPAAISDVRAALHYLRAHSLELGIDTTRIVLIGRSAGGQIALLIAYTARDSAIKGAVGLYSPSDMVWGYNHPTNPRVLNSTEVLQDYLTGTPATAAPRYQDASPYAFAPATSVPTLLLHGTRDELVSVIQSRRLNNRLARYGAPHYLLELPWATHGCDYFINGPCGQLESYAVLRFLAAVTR